MATEPPPPGREHERPDDDATVPFFGSWQVAYGAVVTCAVVVMVLVALFSRWPW